MVYTFTVKHEDVHDLFDIYITADSLTAAWDKIRSKTLDGKKFVHATYVGPASADQKSK